MADFFSKCMPANLLFILCVGLVKCNLQQLYIGCYGDNVTRAMPNLLFAVASIQEYRVETCQQACLGYTFLGAQAGYQCFCADSYNKYGNSSACNIKCAGDLNCGGSYANSVYWVCAIGNYGSNCSSICSSHCNMSISYGIGCFFNGTCPSGCQSGWTGEKCDIDVNECLADNGNCSHYCINTEGSYMCSCQNGFTLNNDGKNCTDVNECMSDNGNCSHYCNNTKGSYICSCPNGFRLNTDGMNCSDVNECMSDNGNCSHYCNNTEGSHICSCPNGFRLNTDGKKCSDVNECMTDNGNCSHYCNNTDGSYLCSCPNGFSLNNDGKNCTDGCLINNGGCSHYCNNVDGCSCQNGYMLKNDNKTCTENNSRGLHGLLALLVLLLIIPAVIIGIFYMSKRRRSKTTHPPTPPPVEGPTTETPDKVDANINTRIHVDQLLPIVVNIGKNPEHLKREFAMLPKPETGKSKFAEKPELIPKNRFKNIIPYDDNRVLLSEIGGDPLTTFINASFIQGYSEDEKIIASHGPTIKTINDFWRMIWEYNVGVIVMVTRCVENGKPKCEQYWTDVGSLEFGDIRVHFQSTDQHADRTVRKMSVRKTGEPATRLVIQLQFIDWPDHGVPEHAISVLAIRHTVKRIIGRNEYIVVHCSAGVGRTGTYLAIDYLLSQAEKEGHVDVYGHVRNLRHQRMNSVQTLAQYSFIFKAVLEGLTLGETTLTFDAFQGYAGKRRTLNPFTKKPFVDTEFQMLKAMLPLPSEDLCSDARTDENTNKNINAAIPMNACRVFIRQPEKGRNDYINAVFIPSFRCKEGYISTQLPLPSTICDFWNMCIDYKCRIILCLCDAAGPTEDVFNFLPKFGQKLQFEKSVVWDMTELAAKDNESYEKRSVKVAPPDVAGAASQVESLYANVQQVPGGSAASVSVIHVFLPEADQTLKRAALLRAQSSLFKAIVETSSTAERTPIIVVSRDGVVHCGQFIAVCNLCDMINTQQTVDVFQTVYNIKRAQPHFFNNMDDYEELYHLTQLSVDQTSLYYNQEPASNRRTMFPAD